jgi:hypothetical protein
MNVPGYPFFARLAGALARGLPLVLLLSPLATTLCPAAGTVVAWGANDAGQATVPAGTANIIAVAGGASHSVALKADGTVVAWGFSVSGQTNVPVGLANVAAIAAGATYTLALQSNGTLVIWGSLATPPLSASNVVAIAGGWYHALALRSDSTVVSWGTTSPVPPWLTNVTAIAAGNGQSLALLNDNSVVAWGDNSYGKTNVPAGLSNVVAIAAGGDHCLALRRDGTLVGWGRNNAGQATVPPGMTNIVAAKGGALHTLVLRTDGTLAAWGDNTYNQTNTTAGDAGYIGISAGGYHNLAIKGDGTPFILVQPASQSVLISKSTTLQVVASGAQPLYYQWMHYNTNLPSATNTTLPLNNVQAEDGGPYVVVVANTFGQTISATALVNAVGGIPVVASPPLDASTICGDGASFTASVGGSTPLSYQWSFGGTNLAGATRSTLVLTNVNLTRAGPYTLTVTNAFGSVSVSANLAVTVQPPSITSSLTVSGVQGVPFTYTIRALHSPSSFGAMWLPAGLNLNPLTGVISGVPSDNGEFAVVLSAYNACSFDYGTLNLTIAPSLPVITSPSTAAGGDGQPFTYQITATASPYLYGAMNLPVGLVVDPATGLISGAPTYAGSYSPTIWASNVWGMGSAPLQIAVSKTWPNNLYIAGVTYNYSTPYLLDFQFSLFRLTSPGNTNTATGVVIDPRLLSATCFEDVVPISDETDSLLVQGNTKLIKVYLVLDYSESIASMSNAVDFMVAGAQDFVNQQSVDTQIGVFEFHRDDMDPSNVVSLTTDKVAVNTAIGGIWTNIVQDFSSGSRVWDACYAAVTNLGDANPDEQHFVVMISDGNDQSSSTTLPNVVAAATSGNVRVFSVGFGKDLNPANLQLLSGQTFGQYYTATNAADLATQLAQVAKDAKAQYILRWATLNRSDTPFTPSFEIAYQSLNAFSPAIIPLYYPLSNAGPVTLGALRLAANAAVQPTGIDLRATYVPRYIRQLRLHYRPNWPCTVTLDNTDVGEILSGYTLTQTNDGAGGFWLLLSSPNPADTATSIPFAAFGRLLTFTFQDVIGTNNAFSVFDIDNSIYTNVLAGGQSFMDQNSTSFIVNYPVLPHGTPVPWLISYGLVTSDDYTNAELADTDGDGAPNWQEYWANTNPRDSNSRFVVRSAIRLPNGRFQVTFSTSTNRTYRVIASTDLTTWQTVQDNIPGVNQDVSIIDTRYLPNLTTIYYRVLVY